MTPCPKCGCKTWDGPRYTPYQFDYDDVDDAKAELDWLAYTCTDCRFVRYEEPLDRKSQKP